MPVATIGREVADSPSVAACLARACQSTAREERNTTVSALKLLLAPPDDSQSAHYHWQSPCRPEGD